MRDTTMRVELAIVQFDPSDGSQAGVETRGIGRRLLQSRVASRELVLHLHESDSYFDSPPILLEVGRLLAAERGRPIARR